MSTIAFIGIGRMGWHMAAHLAKAGHDVVVCDVVPGMADKWVAENGGAAVASPADAVRGREYVITSLPADRELFAVADGIIAELVRAQCGLITQQHLPKVHELLRYELPKLDRHFWMRQFRVVLMVRATETSR